MRRLLVDIHTHVYLPRYARLLLLITRVFIFSYNGSSSFLRDRSTVPRIFTRGNEERLLILEDEPSTGRPIGPQVPFSLIIFSIFN